MGALFLSRGQVTLQRFLRDLVEPQSASSAPGGPPFSSTSEPLYKDAMSPFLINHYRTPCTSAACQLHLHIKSGGPETGLQGGIHSGVQRCGSRPAMGGCCFTYISIYHIALHCIDPPHIVNGKFLESGTAQSKQAAKEAAAKATLIKLGYQFCKLPIPVSRPAFVLILYPRFGPRRTSHFSRVLDTLPSCMQKRSEILCAICLPSIISIVSSPLFPREPANISILV